MTSKLTVKKYIIIGAICILVIAAAVVFLVYTPFRGNASVTETNNGQNADVVKKVEQDSADTADKERHPGVTRINIYSTDRDIRGVIEKYAQEHWDFAYTINCYTDAASYSTSDIISIVGEKLIRGDGNEMDMYCVPAYAQQYIKGVYSSYACTYKELGIDVDTAIKKADIPEHIIKAGSNTEGEVITLPYTADVSVFMYRRSIAKEVWGTDDPDAIAGIIGAGTQKWDKFMAAAQTLKEHGYYMVSGYQDLSYMIDTSLSDDVNPKWEEYMDVSKQLSDTGCIKDSAAWSSFSLLSDLNVKYDKVFGFVTITNYYEYFNYKETAGDWAICLTPFNTQIVQNTGILVNKKSPNKELFGPLIEWITLDCSEEGFQSKMATGKIYPDKKLSVVSGTVMKNVDGRRDFLGGQNINPIVSKALADPAGKQHFYGPEPYMFYNWLSSMDSYLKGEKDKQTAFSDYKAELENMKAVFGLETIPDTVAASDSAKDDAVIVWKDKHFEAVVRNMLIKPAGDIYQSDVNRITELKLDGKNIESIEDVAHLKNLTSLSCYYNNITDISCLKELSKLETLDLPENQISDISSLGSLANLKELRIFNNKISDISCLKGLSNLEILYADSNEITNVSSLGELKKLKLLSIPKNNISDISGISGLTSLEHLDMSDNSISDISNLKDLPSLKVLSLQNNKIRDISSLKGLKQLEMLNLYNNEISSINSLTGLKSLNYVYLNDNKISDISSLVGLTSLTTLDAEKNEIRDISSLGGLKNLNFLNLSDNMISDIRSLGKLKNLKTLFLLNNEIIDISSLKGLTNLESLNLTGNDIADRSPADHVPYVEW